MNIKKRRTKENLNENEYPKWLDKKIWEDFIEFRDVECGKPIWRMGEKRMFNRLFELGIDNHKKILDQSMRNGWQDVYALKNIETVSSNTKLFNPDDHS